MLLSRATACLSLIAASALLAVGCGGETSKADYEDKVNAVNQDLEREFDKFEEGTPTEDEMKDGAKLIADAADELDDIDPPGEVEDTHKELAKTVRQLGDALRTMAPALATGGGGEPNKMSQDDQQALIKAQEDSQQAIEALQKAQEDFQDAGYDIELGAGSDEDADASGGEK